MVFEENIQKTTLRKHLCYEALFIKKIKWTQ